MNGYSKTDSASYIKFLNSGNGRIQQDVIFAAFFRFLSKNPEQKLLDIACGPGWLTKRLSEFFPRTQGCDASEDLIRFAKKQYIGIDFKIADILEPLPYPSESQDTVIFSMAAPDVADLPTAFSNIFTVLKPTGQLLIIIPNPFYTYPVAEWHRTTWEFLSGKKPSLKIKRPYLGAQKTVREFSDGEKIASHFYQLSDYLQAARSAGFQMISFEEIKSEIDSPRFDLQYQLYRYPLLLLVELIRPAALAR